MIDSDPGPVSGHVIPSSVLDKQTGSSARKISLLS